VIEGLQDLRKFLIDNKVKSIAIPPLGAGNGGLDWEVVKPEVERALGDLTDIEITVFEPTKQYQNVAKRTGVEKLTPARALIAELVRRYWVLGMECSLLEIQKLAWFLERSIERLMPGDNRWTCSLKRTGMARMQTAWTSLSTSWMAVTCIAISELQMRTSWT
jgi:hypothetical protein